MYDAQELLEKHQNEIGIKMEPFEFMVYVPEKNVYVSINKVKNSEVYKTISGSELRTILEKGGEIPEWFTYPEVAIELKKSMPAIHKEDLLFFTGLSGSGKSTIANGLLIKLLELGGRPVTLLDGDLVRTHLSSELGFSKSIDL